MSSKSNITVKSNVTLAKSSAAKLNSREKLELHGTTLSHVEPERYDPRLAQGGRRFQGTERQWQEHQDNLECAACGVKGGNCSCTIEIFQPYKNK